MTAHQTNAFGGLTPDEIQHFNEKGWVKVDLFTNDEVRSVKTCIETHSRPIRDAASQEILTFYNNVYNLETPRDLHLFHKPIAAMFTHPKLVTKLISIGGPDLLFWYSNVFCKLPGQGEIKWHQAIEYYSSSDIDFGKKTLIYDEQDTPVNLTVWVAIDEATVDNGCMCFANGSQTRRFDVIPGAQPASEGIFAGIGAHNTVWQRDNKYAFDYEFDENEWPREFVPMRPGQAIIFTERTMHRSGPNTSDKRRLGIIGRYVRPSTTVYPGRFNGDTIDENGHDIRRHFNLLVAGEDVYHRNVIRSEHDLDAVETRFQEMYNLVRFNRVRIPQDRTQLDIEALEQQILLGDCATPEPNPLHYPKKYVRWQAWHQLRGLDKQEAMRRYSHIVEALDCCSDTDSTTDSPADSPKNRRPAGTAGDGFDQGVIEAWIIAAVAEILKIAEEEIDVGLPMVGYGLSSMDIAALTGDLGDWLGVELPPELPYEYPTIEALAAFLSAESGLLSTDRVLP